MGIPGQMNRRVLLKWMSVIPFRDYQQSPSTDHVYIADTLGHAGEQAQLYMAAKRWDAR